ncbi:hypothetical protein LGN17_10915 [Burkholderia sp. AU30280]|uniref:hypothetical protein n=1 Tax=Burkholderia sp. AU30280 TaxID=2879628 RepID=UPI001CF24FBD|nr:hypothetical protein [Burkholderia sp. AU30280]MCA8273022.1 hypothetical protein [Burkholderia sp. AU30280]
MTQAIPYVQRHPATMIALRRKLDEAAVARGMDRRQSERHRSGAMEFADHAACGELCRLRCGRRDERVVAMKTSCNAACVSNAKGNG